MATLAPMGLKILYFQIEFFPIAPNHSAQVVLGEDAKEQSLVPGMLVRKNLKPRFATSQIITKSVEHGLLYHTSFNFITRPNALHEAFFET